MAISQYQGGGGVQTKAGGAMNGAMQGFQVGGPWGAVIGGALGGARTPIGNAALTAIDRRVQSQDQSQQDDPMSHIDAGLEALKPENSPDIPDDAREQAAASLLATKYHAAEGLPYDHLHPTLNGGLFNGGTGSTLPVSSEE